MKRILVAAVLLLLPGSLPAAGLPVSVLGNSGEVLTVRAGTYGELFPGGGELEAERPIVTLDVLRPGEGAERLIVPATIGREVETSPALLHSKKRNVLNVLWTAHNDGEVGLYLVRYADREWSPVAEIYFNADGILPEIVTTRGAFYYEVNEKAVIDLERDTLHLAWLHEEDGQPAVGYSAILLVNGVFIDWKETLTFRPLDADANAPVTALLPATMEVRANDREESIAITFGSSASGRITTLDLELVPMELVLLSDLVRRLALGSGFDPEATASFADTMGAELIGVGSRGRARGRSLLTVSLVDFVATGVRDRILDTGADYSADQVDLLADDLRDYALGLTRSLFSPVADETRGDRSRPTEIHAKGRPILEIDVSDLFDSGDSAPTSHILELRSAVEWPLPDANGAELTLFASDDGLDVVAAWLDARKQKLWYVESNLGLSWTAPQALVLGGELTLEKAQALLQERAR